MKLLVCLGNPGKEYQKTRHNAGFIVADYLYPSAVWQKKFQGLFIQEDVRVLKPQTYMNLSGKSVSEAACFYHMNAEDIIVVHDDLELPFGTARLQKGGGLQGHNGLRSIKEDLGTDQFCRCRIGIGRPKYGHVAQYVLTPFTGDETITLSLLLPKIATMLKMDKIPSEVKVDVPQA